MLFFNVIPQSATLNTLKDLSITPNVYEKHTLQCECRTRMELSEERHAAWETFKINRQDVANKLREAGKLSEN